MTLHAMDTDYSLELLRYRAVEGITNKNTEYSCGASNNVAVNVPELKIHLVYVLYGPGKFGGIFFN